MGPWGIALLMAIESCNIPLPSEAILPFAGYIVSKGEMNIHVAAFAGALGCVIGSIPSYYLGFFGGRKFVENTHISSQMTRNRTFVRFCPIYSFLRSIYYENKKGAFEYEQPRCDYR